MKVKLITLLAMLALLAVVTACAAPASSESANETPAVPATAGTAAVEATAEGGAVGTAVSSEAAPPTQAAPTVAATGEAAATPQASETAATAASPASGATPEAGATSPAGEATGSASKLPAATPAFAEEVRFWPVLLDPEYAFSVRYPQGWLISEDDVAESDAPLVRAYVVEPAGFSGKNAPVTVEVVDGTDEALAKLHPELAKGETRQFAGFDVRVAQVTEGANAGATLYEFQHPDRPDWRVILRVAKDEDTAQAELMANSFRWGALPVVEPTATPAP